MTTQTYLVPEMSCGHCKGKIETQLELLNGIEAIDISVPEKRVTVTFDAAVSTQDAIVKSVETAGYSVKEW